MNDNNRRTLPLDFTSHRYRVRKENIIDARYFLSLSTTSIVAINENCCGNEEKKIEAQPKRIKRTTKSQVNIVSKQNDYLLDVPKQRMATEIVTDEEIPLFYELLKNSWPIAKENVENLIITEKRCTFSNEFLSIKPVTAIPGIGKKYGQVLADHGFIYARQLLGYYLMLKDSDMFRKWLEYRFLIPKFRAAEITSALNEVVRRML